MNIFVRISALGLVLISCGNSKSQSTQNPFEGINREPKNGVYLNEQPLDKSEYTQLSEGKDPKDLIISTESFWIFNDVWNRQVIFMTKDRSIAYRLEGLPTESYGRMVAAHEFREKGKILQLGLSKGYDGAFVL